MNTTLMLSEIIKTGRVAGFGLDSSYDEMVEILGDPPYVKAYDLNVAATYGHLEIFFDREVGLEKCDFLYLNCRNFNDRIQICSKLEFRSQGLRWGFNPGNVCNWLIKNQISFFYCFDKKDEELRDALDIKLPRTDGPEQLFCFYKRAKKLITLGEIYFAK